MKRNSIQYTNTISKAVNRTPELEADYRRRAKAFNRKIRAAEATNKRLSKALNENVSSSFLREYAESQRIINTVLDESQKSRTKQENARLPERTKKMTDEQFSRVYNALSRLENYDLSKKHAQNVYEGVKDIVGKKTRRSETAKDMQKKILRKLKTGEAQEIVDFAIDNSSQWQMLRNTLGSERATSLYSSLRNDKSISQINLSDLVTAVNNAISLGNISKYDHAGLYQYAKDWVRMTFAKQESGFYQGQFI